MKAQKFYRKASKFIFFSVLGIFFMMSAVAEAAEIYTIGIVGIESRIKDTNVDKFMDSTNADKTPLEYTQEFFQDIILNSDLQKIGLRAVEKTAYSKMARSSEMDFRKNYSYMTNAISLLDKGDTSEAVKLFDKKLEYLIYGCVNNMSVSHREAFGMSNSIVNVNLSVRIVDAETGKIVCVAVGRGSASNHGESYRETFDFGEDKITLESWREAIQKAMDQVVEKIIKQA